jgi:hypothetical protein
MAACLMTCCAARMQNQAAIDEGWLDLKLLAFQAPGRVCPSQCRCFYSRQHVQMMKCL